MLALLRLGRGKVGNGGSEFDGELPNGRNGGLEIGGGRLEVFPERWPDVEKDLPGSRGQVERHLVREDHEVVESVDDCDRDVLQVAEDPRDAERNGRSWPIVWGRSKVVDECKDEHGRATAGSKSL